MPELQGEPEEISKEKAKIAAKEVLHPSFIAYILYIHTCSGAEPEFSLWGFKI